MNVWTNAHDSSCSTFPSLLHQLPLLEFCQIPGGRSGQPPAELKLILLSVACFLTPGYKLAEELGTSMLTEKLWAPGKERKGIARRWPSTQLGVRVWECTHTFPALLSLCPPPSPSPFRLYPLWQRNKGLVWGWSPLITHRSICAHTKEKTHIVILRSFVFISIQFIVI